MLRLALASLACFALLGCASNQATESTIERRRVCASADEAKARARDLGSDATYAKLLPVLQASPAGTEVGVELLTGLSSLPDAQRSNQDYAAAWGGEERWFVSVAVTSQALGRWVDYAVTAQAATGDPGTDALLSELAVRRTLETLDAIAAQTGDTSDVSGEWRLR